MRGEIFVHKVDFFVRKGRGGVRVSLWKHVLLFAGKFATIYINIRKFAVMME